MIVARRVAGGWLPALAVSLVLLNGRALARQQETPTFRSSVEITRVAVAVLDRDGLPVPGLGRDDFRVVEGLRPRDVQVALAPDNASLDVGLVLDFSTSIAEDWPEARQSAHEFLDSLQEGDCVFLLPFNDRVGPGVWGAPDSAALRKALDEFPMQGLTHLYDAIRMARDAIVDRELMRLEPSLGAGAPPERAGCETASASAPRTRRQAVVVLTDGADLGSETSYADLLVDSWRAEVPVFSVAVGVAATNLRGGFLRRDATDIRLLQNQLNELARATGGQFFMQQRLRSGYAEILNVLRGLYVIAFRGTGSAQWSALEVTVPGTRHRVIVQPGILYVDAAARSGARDVRRGLLLATSGRLPEAEAALAAAVAAEPDELAAPIYLGMVREGLGHPAEAREAFREALARVPGAVAALAGIARTSLALGDTKSAWEYAIAARQAGADVSPVILALRGTPEPSDIEARLDRQVVGLLAPSTPDLAALLATRDLRRRIARALLLDGFAVTTSAFSGDVVLTLRVEKFAAREGEGGTLRARLQAWSLAGDQEEDAEVEIEDLRDDAAVELALQGALPPLLEWMRQLREAAEPRRR